MPVDPRDPSPTPPPRPRHRPAAVAAAAVAALVLLVGACGSGDDAASDTSDVAAVGDPADVVVSGEASAKPTVTYEWPLSVATTSSRVITDGDGEVIGDGVSVVFDYVALNARDGKEFDSSYGETPLTVVMDENQTLPGMVKGLLGTKVGSRVLMAIAPVDAFQPMGGIPDSGIEADDSLVIVADVRSIRTPLARAAGTDVAPVDGLPTVVRADDGAPTITVPATPPPTELIAQALIQGDGAEVTEGQTLLTHYTGVIWGSGKEFDSSWTDGSPATFSLAPGAVIDGFSQGLVGQKVGTQVLLVVPPEVGYGADGNPDAGIAGTDTLVFVVDILDAY